ncbi:phosphatase PAP2 family protein [Bradyrhizobium oligotrophicum]|uniref:phosphatase PAP2 family protein n=1 Tax=Bradyrhizobium oligotrophicum TaxID=44255 RepID=UPI003EB7B563
MLAQGLQVTEQAITHVAGPHYEPTAKELGFSNPANMELWADWVRGSLYITDFLKELDWRVDEDQKKVCLSYGHNTFLDVQRPAMACFEKQLDFMIAYLDQRPDRTPEILTQVGFPTPYFAMILGLQAGPNRYIFELIAITQVLASHVAMILKHHLACRRPDRIGAKVMPMIPTPAHGSFPSAHATEAFAVAEVLRGFVEYHCNKPHYADFKRRRELLSKLAERIAVNRTVAGVHYPIDTWAGAILGRAVGQIVLAKCHGREVDGYSYRAVGTKDFFLKEFVKAENDEFGVAGIGKFELGASPLFSFLWRKASDELSLHDGSQ